MFGFPCVAFIQEIVLSLIPYLFSLSILLSIGSRLAELILPLYVLFFLAAALGWFCDRIGKKIKFLTIPYYFCLVNLAATFAIVDFFQCLAHLA